MDSLEFVFPAACFCFRGLWCSKRVGSVSSINSTYERVDTTVGAAVTLYYYCSCVTKKLGFPSVHKIPNHYCIYFFLLLFFEINSQPRIESIIAYFLDSESRHLCLLLCFHILSRPCRRRGRCLFRVAHHIQLPVTQGGNSPLGEDMSTRSRC